MTFRDGAQLVSLGFFRAFPADAAIARPNSLIGSVVLIGYCDILGFLVFRFCALGSTCPPDGP